MPEDTNPKSKKHMVAKYSITAVILVLGGLTVSQVLGEADTGSQAEIDPISENPMIGDENASIQAILYGDYKCTECVEVSRFLLNSTFKQNYIDSGDVNLYFLNYNYLNNEDGFSSTRAAIAGECVYRQDEDAFWKFHQNLYNNQGPKDQDWATQQLLEETARESTENINYDDFDQCLQEEETLEKVQRDKNRGIEMSVGQAPALFIDGENIDATNNSAIRNAIEKRLQ